MSTASNNNSKKTGVLIGGSGLIGGAITYYFKSQAAAGYEILAPSSKKLSVREPADISLYFRKYQPDFIINAAIASIDSDPQLAYETNFLGSVRLARMACDLKIPYIHIGSAVTMPMGEDLDEDRLLPLTAELGNYAKSKLMAELALRHMHETLDLDYSCVRLAIVYGTHDHKIQGFHRLFYSIVNRAMPALLTRPGVMHSYSNCRKLPSFIHHLLEHRGEFSGQTYNFVDRSPVSLAQLILTIKSYLELSFPKAVHIPYPAAMLIKGVLQVLVTALNRIGVEARMPAEAMFLENFYQSQTLSAAKLAASSYVDPWPEATIFTALPEIIQYYLTRWEQLRIIPAYNKEFFDPRRKGDEFVNAPAQLLQEFRDGELDIFR